MSQVDELILNLVDSGRQASVSELATIVGHVAQAPFAVYLAKVPNQLRQLLSGQGIQLPSKLSSLEIHLLKRVNEEEQWPKGTTAAQYVAALHQAISHSDVQIWYYRYYGQPFIGFLSPTPVQMTEGARAYTFVAYSPTYGTIMTGYQATSADTIFTDGYTDLKRQR